jgi:endosialidase-like protein
VGIGVSTPSRTLEIKTGGTTLADNWTIRSSRRFKTNIQPLQDALGRIEALQGVSYERTSDGKHEIGVVAEDVDRVIPEVVAHDPETHEVEGVDYSRLVALLIEGMKAQQAEIEQLKSQMVQLTSNAAKQ